MANMQGAITRHANTAVVKLNGETIAEAVGVSVRESGGTDPTHVIGDARPKEHVHNRYSVSVQVQRLVFKEGATVAYGVGGASLLLQEPVDIEGVDDVDGRVLFGVTDCTLSDRDQSINANSRIQGNLTFQGLDVTNGAGSDPSGFFPNNGVAV